jgi:hypothetical protein
VILLSALGITWVLILLYVILEFLHRRKRKTG